MGRHHRLGGAPPEDRDLRSLAADEDIREAEVDLGLLARPVVGDDRDIDVLEAALAPALPDVPAHRGLGRRASRTAGDAPPRPARPGARVGGTANEERGGHGAFGRGLP